MQIRKLDTWQDWLTVDQIIATAFMFKWNQKEAEEKRKAEADGTRERQELAWGLFDDNDRIVTGIITTRHDMTFDGQVIPTGELNMVGSLPEARDGGNVRAMMREILRDMKARGDLFATLHPFSYRFYRKFGFELMNSELRQTAPVAEFADFGCSYRVNRVSCEEDMPKMKALYEAFILQRNLRMPKDEKAWVYHGNGEFGERDMWQGDRDKYTYLFTDEDGTLHAYLSFTYTADPQNFWVGTMRVSELVYDSPYALRQALGFTYSLRAKVRDMELTLPGGPDLSLIVPECNKITRKLECSTMIRVLNVEEILSKMKQPVGEGSYTVHIDDAFLTENTATYQVCYQDGVTTAVAKTNEPADIVITAETFGQAATGQLDMHDIAYRVGTSINGNTAVLQQVFVKKS